ncbi:MAG: hypothetical protein Q8N47_28360 [Bryobacterales bacterium]|nr:hypothetical protein [Bryobacterales bacterium]
MTERHAAIHASRALPADFAFGVRNVWLIDPRARRAFAWTSDGSRELKDGVLRSADPAFELSLAELYEAMAG